MRRSTQIPLPHAGSVAARRFRRKNGGVLPPFCGAFVTKSSVPPVNAPSLPVSSEKKIVIFITNQHKVIISLIYIDAIL